MQINKSQNIFTLELRVLPETMEWGQGIGSTRSAGTGVEITEFVSSPALVFSSCTGLHKTFIFPEGAPPAARYAPCRHTALPRLGSWLSTSVMLRRQGWAKSLLQQFLENGLILMTLSWIVVSLVSLTGCPERAEQ